MNRFATVTLTGALVANGILLENRLALGHVRPGDYECVGF
jgi:hypothetical protein